MVEAEIEAILNEAIGLKLTSIGSSTLDRAVNRRMRALEIADNKLYLTCLKSSPAELKQLIEEVVIPETWFFRDEKPFQVVQRFVAAAGKDKVFRLLSAPCSTGEEPYSLVITLLQAGVPESNFQVVGMDISSRALKKAAAATYSENSFRTIDLGFRSRYFKKTGAGYVLDDQVRRNVTFKQGNLLNQAFMEYLGKFDIIFCRNLLIYLDRKAQQQSLDTLARLQAKDGLFFVGHAEAGIMRGAGFRAVSDYTTLAFQKIGDQEGSTPRAPQDMAAGGRPILFKSSNPEVAPVAGTTSLPSPAAGDSGAAGSNGFDRARQLAEQGRFGEASGLCEVLLRRQGPSAPVYFLLGGIRDAEGALEEAMMLFKKSVYLDPDNFVGLERLALLAERLGDNSGAEGFRQRAQRIRERGDKRPVPASANSMKMVY